ncbi:MAG: hypothetical protein DRQ60_04325 [Gammaproteobacteria bacterium]|nr:MAG: hypothetical protein DRQ60_04325 [Gammaproteobacteria bacterium]
MKLRTGQDYLTALADDRNLWFSGERVNTITDHPELSPIAKTLAEVFDLHNDPEYRDRLTCKDSDGQTINASYRALDSIAAIGQRRETIDFWARRSGGVAGRIPDYQAIINCGLYDMRHVIAAGNPQWLENIENWFFRVRDNNLLQTHAFADAPRDRNTPGADPGYLKIVERRAGGIVINGAKSIATIAPFADEFLGLTSPRPGMQAEEVLFFSLPMNADGLHIICRESLIPRAEAGHPLAPHWDELDAYMIFDHVLVPNDRIFHLQPEGEVDINLLGQMFFGILSWPLWHILARASVKLELLIGLADSITDHLGKRQDPAVIATLANMAIHLEAISALLYRAEHEPVPSAGGMLLPNPRQITAGRVAVVDNHPQLLQQLRELSGSGIMMSPSSRELDHPDIGALMRANFVGNDPRATNRFALQKLAWDLTCDSFGSRQLLFEMLNAGGAQLNKTMFMETCDLTDARQLAMDLAGIGREGIDLLKKVR